MFYKRRQCCYLLYLLEPAQSYHAVYVIHLPLIKWSSVLTCVHPSEVDHFVDAMGLEGLQPVHPEFFFLFLLCIRPSGLGLGLGLGFLRQSSSSHVCSLWQDISIGTNNFDHVTLTLKFNPLFKNFNIGHIFWMASDRAFIFHMCVSYDKSFLLVQKILTSWPRPWILTHFSKTLTLVICFEWQVIRLSYFICEYLMTRPFYWYQHFLPCGLDLEV
jgi:hypothetical protein